MRSIHPKAWNPDRPRSVNCAIGKVYRTPVSKREREADKQREERIANLKALAKLDAMFGGE